MTVAASVTVMYPEEDEAVVGSFLKQKYEWVNREQSRADAEFKECGGSKPGYAAQIYDKMTVPDHVPQESEYIFHIDSDTILLRELRLDDLFERENHGRDTIGRQRMERVSYAQAGKDAEKAWRNSTSHALGLHGSQIEYAFMTRMGSMHPVSLFRSAASRLVAQGAPKGDKTLKDWHLRHYCATGRADYSEFEILGGTAWLDHHDEFLWEQPSGIFPVFQSWSWGGMNDNIAKFFRCCLEAETGPSPSDRLENGTPKQCPPPPR